MGLRKIHRRHLKLHKVGDHWKFRIGTLHSAVQIIMHSRILWHCTEMKHRAGEMGIKYGPVMLDCRSL